MQPSNIGIYLHRPPDRLGPILRNAGKILRRRARLQRGKFGILSFPAFFQKRLHASGVFPSTERNPWEFLHTLHFFRLVPGPCFQRLVFFRLDIIPARNRINGKLRHPVFHGLGKNALPVQALPPQEYLPPACGPLPHVRAVPAPPFSFFPVLRVRPAPEAYGPLPPPAAPSLPALPHKPSGPPAVPFPSSP